MILKPSPLSSRRFSYNRDLNLLVTEISDLGPGFSFGQVYDDACDEGLTVVSVRTGREVVYGLHDMVRDGEGELLYYELRPANPSESGLPTIQIFND